MKRIIIVIPESSTEKDKKEERSKEQKEQPEDNAKAPSPTQVVR